MQLRPDYSGVLITKPGSVPGYSIFHLSAGPLGLALRVVEDMSLCSLPFGCRSLICWERTYAIGRNWMDLADVSEPSLPLRRMDHPAEYSNTSDKNPWPRLFGQASLATRQAQKSLRDPLVRIARPPESAIPIPCNSCCRNKPLLPRDFFELPAPLPASAMDPLLAKTSTSDRRHQHNSGQVDRALVLLSISPGRQEREHCQDPEAAHPEAKAGGRDSAGVGRWCC